MGDVGAVERDGLKLAAALGTRSCCASSRASAAKRSMCWLTASKVMATACRNCSRCRSAQSARSSRPRRSATLAFESVEAEGEQLFVVDREVGISRGHVALGLDDAALQQRLLLVGEEAVAAILHRLAAPEGG